MSALVSMLVIGLIAVGYVLQNWLMDLAALAEDETAHQLIQTIFANPWVTFSILAVVGALLPFLIYVVATLYIIRRQER